MTVPETAIQNRHNNIILTCISLIPFVDYTLSYLILHIGVQYLPDIVRLPSAVRDKETVQIGIVRHFLLQILLIAHNVLIINTDWDSKMTKKQIRNNKIKKPQNERMRKHKLTLKTTIIFRFYPLIVQVNEITFISSLC